MAQSIQSTFAQAGIGWWDGGLGVTQTEPKRLLRMDVDTGEITTAIRSVEVDEVKVKEGETIALFNGKLVASAGSLEEVCNSLLDKIDVSQYELITLFYGEDITKHEGNKIAFCNIGALNFIIQLRVGNRNCGMVCSG